MDEASIVRAQDDMRPFRMFVGALTGALMGADQSAVGTDYTVANWPYQYQSVGPYGVAVEGSPVAATRGGGLYISPMVVLIGIGAALMFIAKK